jgi:hypothetical protein
MPHELHDSGEIDSSEHEASGKGVAKVMESAAGDA